MEESSGINLNTFCGDGSDMRFYLTTPFSDESHTYATNGKLIVVVPKREEVPVAKEFQEKIIKNTQDFLEKTAGEQTAPFDALLPQEVEATDCEACEGTGRGHPDCPDCECDCNRCSGSGKWKEWKRVRFATFDLSEEYVRIIVTLPDVKIQANVAPDAKFIRLEFNGGVGFVAPMIGRDKYKDADTILAKVIG